MTTFQDLPPQSRRAVRQSERDGDTSAQVASGSLPTAQPFLPAAAAAAAASADGQQPAAAPPPASGRRSRAAAPSGLVDMPTTPPASAAEPLTYTTQASPAYQQPAPQDAAAPQAPEQFSAEQQAYRVRDFSPEGRRSAQPAQPGPAAQQQPTAAPLDYRTQAGPAQPQQAQPQQAQPQQAQPPQAWPQQTQPQQAQPQAAPASTTPPVAVGPVDAAAPVGLTQTAPPAAPTSTTPPVVSPAAAPTAAAAPSQTTPPAAQPSSRRAAAAAPQQTSPDLPTQTLSRRELRALQAEQDAATALTSGTYEVPPLVEPVAAPPSNLSNAMAEFEALTRSSQAAQQAAQQSGQQNPAAQQSATASQPDIFGAARAEQARIEQAERARAEQAEQAARDNAAQSQTAQSQAAQPQAAQQQAAQQHEAQARAEAEGRTRFEQDERARADAQARAQQATQAEAAQLAQAHAARAHEEAAQQQAAQQQARETAAAAQATAQAEANARARADSQQQAEILARREWDAQQAAAAAQQAAAQQAAGQQAAAQQASAQPAQPTNPFDALLGDPSAPAANVSATNPPATNPAATNPPASDPLTALFVEPSIEQTGSHATSTGHWSQQAQIEDDEQPFENTLSRDVGGGNVATTTSALVLPVMPTADFGGIISGTGEILVTGSIELPRSLGATGGDSRRYDDPDVDNLFDAFDNEIISTDSAPVRAIRAVSTHTSTHGVITTANKPHGNRLLTAALIAIPVLILGIAGLLIAAFSSGMF